MSHPAGASSSSIEAAAREGRYRVEIFVLALMVGAYGGLYGIPAFLAGIQGLSPPTVSCADLVGRRFHPEHDGRHVRLSGCEPDFDDLSGSVNVFNQAVSELRLPLYVAPRQTGRKPMVTAVIRRDDLVSPFSNMNATQTHAMRRGQYPEPDLAQVDAVVAARAAIAREFDGGLGGVLQRTELIHGDPPGFGLGYLAMFLVGALFAALAAFAPRERMAGVFALLARFQG